LPEKAGSYHLNFIPEGIKDTVFGGIRAVPNIIGKNH
jgi:hypothetical protein